MNELESILRQEILPTGSISFARFMELALYCPKIGYYERERVPGRKGDFYTSVSVGPLFGELLARRFADWFKDFATKPPTLVEAGAHDGQLALDILSWLRKFRPELALQYWIVEPSERRRAWQRSKLDFFADEVTWFATFAELPSCVSGIIFCNELLDAMPVHILQWAGGKWIDLRVGLRQNALAWQSAELPADLGQPVVPPELAAVLPESFQIEVSPATLNWWRSAGAKLSQGKLVTIDYGFEQEDLLSPQRLHGTVRAYYRHHLSDDLLARPGEQDITSHVNFTEIQRAGEEAGLRTEAFVSQSRFLTDIAAGISNWTPECVRQFQTLTHPEHLGRSFRVLIQSR